MKTFNNYILINILFCSLTSGQHITNSLGTNGIFSIKDISATYLTLSQTNGYLALNKSLTLMNTSSSTIGVIFKGTDRFIHDYSAPGTDGYNTFIGINAGNFTMSGSGIDASYNTGIGSGSLTNITTGYENAAFGSCSLYNNTSGSLNTSLGVYSLWYNSTGTGNTALGYEALYYSGIGIYNIAVGYKTLYNNYGGYYNTALGFQAMYSNTGGKQNIAIGYETLFSNTGGDSNISLGLRSCWNNITGKSNVALGVRSLEFMTSGNDNTAIGHLSGSSITTGSNLTCIGFNSQSSSSLATNQITLGNSSITSLRCNVTTITSLSDMRDKKNIKDLSLGLEFLCKLKPRQFNWDKREWYKDNNSDGSKMQETPTAGFIAQELDEAQTNENAEWLNLVLKDNPEKLEATPGNLFPVVVKAIQELNNKYETLKQENELLKIEVKSIHFLKDRLAKLEQMISDSDRSIEVKSTEK